ncbi:MAG: single-stranded DNA-binding protein [Caldilineaceae bacterium SB0665_bin_21]|nr:single-stranded DNA-binding protein [Caldilineaceae bacterium SB0665_bin_21]MYA03351.1 single-stranded DNA-binding protein [Caldilineaceae bacterium SB0664_bin_22]
MPSGDKVCSFNVAVNNVYNDRSGERRTDTTWFRVSAFGRQAETCGQYLRRGRQVLVTGRVKSNAFMGQDGQPRASLDVRANTVQFLGGRDDQAGGDWGGGSGGSYGRGSSSGSDWDSGSGGGSWQGGNQGGDDWRSRDGGGSSGDGGASGTDIDDGQDVPF